jgi:hypothetical protein
MRKVSGGNNGNITNLIYTKNCNSLNQEECEGQNVPHIGRNKNCRRNFGSKLQVKKPFKREGEAERTGLDWLLICPITNCNRCDILRTISMIAE